MRTAWHWMWMCAALPWALSVRGEDKTARPEWDQARAEAMVRAAVKMEQAQGQPWDNIPWLTDVEAAVARAAAG